MGTTGLVCCPTSQLLLESFEWKIKKLFIFESPKIIQFKSSCLKTLHFGINIGSRLDRFNHYIVLHLFKHRLELGLSLIFVCKHSFFQADAIIDKIGFPSFILNTTALDERYEDVSFICSLTYTSTPIKLYMFL